jgi:hypothetical protein
MLESQADFELLKKKAMNNVLKKEKRIPRNFSEIYENEVQKLIEEEKEIPDRFEKSIENLTKFSGIHLLDSSELPEKASSGVSFGEIGQRFHYLPSFAPEGAIMRRGNQRFIFKNGKWSLL